MAIFSMTVGLIIFIVSTLMVQLLVSAVPDESNMGFGLFLAMFPIVLSCLLIIPSTVYRCVDVLRNQVPQTLFEKLVLFCGCAASLFVIGFVVVTL